MIAMPSFAPLSPTAGRSVHCATCGIPVDAQPFDEHLVVGRAPALGEEITLAQFELPARYCGVLEYFAQYTDSFSRNPVNVETPGLSWSVRSNGRPMNPYGAVARIVNPWGFGSFPLTLRIDEGARVSVVVTGVPAPAAVKKSEIAKRVGARIVGRYWYEDADLAGGGRR